MELSSASPVRCAKFPKTKAKIPEIITPSEVPIIATRVLIFFPLIIIRVIITTGMEIPSEARIGFTPRIIRGIYPKISLLLL